MANINSLTTSGSNSYSSIYGNKNIISGLASGMDTETMIENAVSGYQTKIIQLQQEQTRIEWKQEGFRDLIGEINDITQKYTSYTSKTNLASNAFFTRNTTTKTTGANAAAVTASGSSSSEIVLNSVSQLAASARYAVKASALNYENATNLTGTAIDTSSQEISAITGSLSLMVGSQRVELDFGEDEVFNSVQDLADAINKKLEDQKVSAKVELADNTEKDADGNVTSGSYKLNFSSTADNGDAVYLIGAKGDMANKLSVRTASSTAAEDRFDYDSITVGANTPLTSTRTAEQYLSGKTVEVTYNGETKQLSVGELKTAGEAHAVIQDQIALNLQKELDKAFGTGNVTVTNDGGKLSFGVADNTATLYVQSDTKALGLENSLSNYFNTESKLGAFIGEDAFKTKGNYTGDVADRPAVTDDEGNQVKDADGRGIYYDEDGKRINADGYRVDDSGKVIEEGELVINGVKIGTFTKDSTMKDVLDQINGSDAGIKASFSKLTGEFVFTTNGTGTNQKIEFGEGLASRLFASDEAKYTAGQNAKFTATVNGEQIELERGSNTVDMDGMSVTLKKTFADDGEGVGFETNTDSDKIIETIKSFADDINKLMEDTHKAFSTQPLRKSSAATALASSKGGSSGYMPLTEKDKEGMSESAIKAYEEKAKTGLLFQDTDLSAMYNSLRNVLTNASVRKDLEAIGITTGYSNNVTTLKVDEDKLRSALESDPDKVRKVFTDTIEGGASRNGLIEQLKAPLKTYGSTSLGSQGVLVKKAGTKLSAVSMLNNDLQKQIGNYDTQIESWQSKMSAKIDYYTKQFTALEKLMSTMNSQSSMLSQMMGY